MKDQVDALRTSGIAATFLNSALDGSERAHDCADSIVANIVCSMSRQNG